MKSHSLLSELERLSTASPMAPACYDPATVTALPLLIPIFSVLVECSKLLIYLLLFLFVIIILFIYYYYICITEEQDTAQEEASFPPLT